MMRWLSIAVRGLVVLVVLLSLATATARPLAGQQAVDSVTHIGAGAVPARSASTTGTGLPGPRVRPDFQRVEPSFAGREASSSTAVASHTFTVTTVVLVLAVIIIVLLVAD